MMSKTPIYTNFTGPASPVGTPAYAQAAARMGLRSPRIALEPRYAA